MAVVEVPFTVPSGKVGSNLTGFPVMVDLSEMPSEFWDHVAADGGDIRALEGATELPIDEPGTVGHHLSTVGLERGTVTGRARRCGWLDAAALKRSVIINGISGLCITKLDVLDGLPEIQVCVGYRLGNRTLDILPLDADDIAACEPVYETFPGWQEKTFGLTRWEELPLRARAYLERVQALIGSPIDMVSTGPDREHTILLRHPYKH